jgi:hypothetical protein
MVTDLVWTDFQDDHNAAFRQWLGDYQSLFLTSTTIVAAWSDPRAGSSSTHFATAPLP